MAEFVRENIFYKFGFLREIVTDKGAQFTTSLIEYLMKKHPIKHMPSTAYPPQENGQVEVTEIAWEKILTKVVSNNRKY